MLTSLWRSGFSFVSYVCDVGLWFRFIKYGSTWHKQKLDKIIATGILQGKDNNIAPRLVFYFNLTSADKSWWIDCTDTSLMDSEIPDNRSLIIQTVSSIPTKNNELKYFILVGRTQREIHIYSSNLIIVKMTFQLRRFDSSYKETIEIKTLKRTCVWKNKNKYKMISVWSKFCLNQEATTHSYAWEINDHMS